MGDVAGLSDEKWGGGPVRRSPLGDGHTLVHFSFLSRFPGCLTPSSGPVRGKHGPPLVQEHRDAGMDSVLALAQSWLVARNPEMGLHARRAGGRCGPCPRRRDPHASPAAGECEPCCSPPSWSPGPSLKALLASRSIPARASTRTGERGSAMAWPYVSGSGLLLHSSRPLVEPTRECAPRCSTSRDFRTASSAPAIGWAACSTRASTQSSTSPGRASTSRRRSVGRMTS